MKKLYIRWNTIDWTAIKSKVLKWQMEIYSASKKNDIKTVRKFQHKIFWSPESKLLSVRHVTQDRNDKKTKILDGVEFITLNQKLELAKSLVISNGMSPLRKMRNPKPDKLEKRHIRILRIKDYCLQTLFKLALEPEWEAKFEKSVYSSRPGRNCHDAVKAVRVSIQKRPKYVLDASIVRCFDQINHEYLLYKIGMKGKYRKQLRNWFQYGTVDIHMLSDTRAKPSQKGILSSLLTNIALHGMEEFCKKTIKDHIIQSMRQQVKFSRKKDRLGFVRYGEDFVIIHSDLKIITLLQRKLPEFLDKIGLKLSPAKTRIAHTLKTKEEVKEICPLLDNKPGFNFLGFHFRQYKIQHPAILSFKQNSLNFQVLVIPSKEKQRVHQQELHELILKQGKSLTQNSLITKLNQTICKWSNYFGKSDANRMKIFERMDYLLYLKLRQWAKRTYKKISKGKVAFRRKNPHKWIFATETTTLVRHTKYSKPLSRYIKTRKEPNPYDHNHIYLE